MPDETFNPAPWVWAYRQMHAAMLSADTHTLRSLISADFVLVHMTGYAQSGTEWLQHIDNGRMRYFTSEEESVELLGSGEQRRLRGRNWVRANIWGTHGTWPLQMLVDFRLQQGRWLMVKATASTY